MLIFKRKDNVMRNGNEMVSVINKVESGEYLRNWNEFSPFYAGSYYGDSVCLGGEDKFSHCYDFFMGGGGSFSYWIKEELDKLSNREKHELLSLMKRNKKVDDSITLELVESIAVKVGYDSKDTHYIYRLKNKNIIRLAESDDIKATHKKILDEIDFDPVTLGRK